MRWYDMEPDVCIAISMIELADFPVQMQCAKYIIDEIKKRDTDYTYLKNSAQTGIYGKKNRWYDKNELIATAFEYLKHTSRDIQIEVAKDVLNYKKCAV